MAGGVEVEGDLERVLVTTGRVRVDTEELRRAAIRLGGIVAELEHLAAGCSRAEELALGSASLVPQTTGAAVDACECARIEVLRLLRMAEGGAERLAFASSILEIAEGEALRIFAGDGSFKVPDLSGGAWGARLDPFMALLPGARLLKDRALIADLGLAVGAFVTGEGDGMVGPRFEWDALLLGGRIAGPAWFGLGGGGTRRAARMVGAWALLGGMLVHGRSRGIEVIGPVSGPSTSRGAGGSPEDGPGGGANARVFGGGGGFAAGEPAASDARPEVKGHWTGVGVVPLVAGFIASRMLPREVLLVSGNVSDGTSPVPAAPTGHATPRTPSELLGELSDLPSGGERGGLKILKHETPLPDGGMRTSWSVVIRGTQRWGAGGSNPQDMLTNLQEVGGLESDQSRAVLQAMEMAGIGRGEPVEFVGHSQGGIVAARLASDPAVGARYSVVSALTAGSPIAASSPPEGVGVLALENTRDIVPALDGAGNAEGVVTVRFDGRGRSGGSPGVPAAHDLATYRSLMADIEEGAGSSREDPSFAPVRSWEAARAEGLGLNDRTRTSEFRYETRRILG